MVNAGIPPVDGKPSPGNGSCGTADLPRARAWRLTNAQFKNTALAVFGFAGPTTDQLPPDGQPEGYANQPFYTKTFQKMRRVIKYRSET